MKFATLGVLAAAGGMLAAGAAQAGGLERGGYNIDLLFDPSPFAAEATGTYVMPQRKLDNVVGTAGGRTDGIDETESYFVPRIGFKAGLGDSVDCMVDYSQPWGAHTNPGNNWAGAVTNIETDLNSHNYAATCSYKMQLGKGQFRLIGGAFYQELEGFKERRVVPFIPTSVGRLDLEGDGWGWRIGAAYEIPEIAFRTSLVYNSRVKLDDVTGELDLTRVPPAVDPTNPLLGVVTPVFGSATMPENVEWKIQTGVAPGWLVMGSVKWTNWSILQAVPFCPESIRGVMDCSMSEAPRVRATELDLYYRDGWTVSAGVGHRFNEQWSGAAHLTWDRGTSTTIGHQSDTWTLSGGVAYTPTANAEFRLGGALGVLTSGRSEIDRHGTAYTYGNDFIGALSATAKITW